MIETYKYDELKDKYHQVSKLLKNMDYFKDIPNMDSLENVKGYGIGRHLGLNTSPFLKTLNAVNHFVDKIEASQKALETKYAQMMIIGASLLNRPSLNTLE